MKKINLPKSSKAILRTCFVLVALIFSPSMLQAATSASALVVLFGDSITYGHPRGEGGNGNGLTNVNEPDKALQRLFDQSNRKAIVSNFGSGGTPTGPSGFEQLIAGNNGRERVGRDLQAATALYPSTGDRYVVIMYGFNDRDWGIPNSVTGDNIDFMIRTARSLGYTPVVGTIAPCVNVNVKKDCNPTIVPRNSIIASVVSQLNGSSLGPVFFVDQYQLLVGNIRNLVISDGIHPNTLGYNEIANNWFNVSLASLIEPQNVAIMGAITLLLFDDE